MCINASGRFRIFRKLSESDNEQNATTLCEWDEREEKKETKKYLKTTKKVYYYFYINLKVLLFAGMASEYDNLNLIASSLANTFNLVSSTSAHCKQYMY